MNQLLKYQAQNPFLLAPMAGITDCAFRSFMKEMGAGILTTELISAKGLKFNSEKTVKLASFSKEQSPVGIQVFGESPEDLLDASLWAQDQGADFVDLNFGCPVPKVVKKMAGSAVLKDLNLLSNILKKINSKLQIPLTIKTRTGWDQNSRNSDLVSHIAYNEGVTWMSIHGRTRAQGYSGDADWGYIKWVKSLSKIPIIGNGDLNSPEVAVNHLKESKCDAVMVGRGALKNPWIFKQALSLYNDQKIDDGDLDIFSVIRKLERHLSQFHTEKVTTLQLKKFSSWFSAGYPNATSFRQNVFKSKDKSEALKYIEDYFKSIDTSKGLKTSNAPFLMGGHG